MYRQSYPTNQEIEDLERNQKLQMMSITQSKMKKRSSKFSSGQFLPSLIRLKNMSQRQPETRLLEDKNKQVLKKQSEASTTTLEISTNDPTIIDWQKKHGNAGDLNEQIPGSSNLSKVLKKALKMNHMCLLSLSQSKQHKISFKSR